MARLAGTEKGAKLLGKMEIAEILGLNKNTVMTRIKYAANVKPDGKTHSGHDGYKIMTVLHIFSDLLGEMDTSQMEARERKLLAEAKLAEQELALKKGLVAPINEVDHEILEVIGQVKAAFLNLPKKVAPILLSCDSLQEITKILEEEVYECLSRLANNEFGRVQHDAEGTESDMDAGIYASSETDD